MTTPAPVKKEKPSLRKTVTAAVAAAAKTDSDQQKTKKKKAQSKKLVTVTPNKPALALPSSARTATFVKKQSPKSWGKKRLLVRKEPRATRRRSKPQFAVESTTHHPKAQNDEGGKGGSPALMNSRDLDLVSAFQQQTSTKFSGVPHPGKVLSLPVIKASTGSDFQEAHSTPQKQLLAQPLMRSPLLSLSPPLPPIGGYRLILPSCGVIQHQHQAWKQDVGLDVLFSTAELNCDQNAVRVSFFGRHTTVSPIRPPPAKWPPVRLVSDESLPMVQGQRSIGYASRPSIPEFKENGGDLSTPTMPTISYPRNEYPSDIVEV